VNYGYLPGTQAPDGCQIDAYILGVDWPLRRFLGRCIAVVERLDDIEGKLVIVPVGQQFTDEEIEAATGFQERYFKIRIRRARVKAPRSDVHKNM
jgi:inorganic pyrophosphatase